VSSVITEEIFFENARKMIENKSEKIFAFCKEKFSDLINKSKIDLKTAFIDYLTNSYDKHSRIKTILYKNQPRFLYDFFECNDLLLDNDIIDCSSVISLIDISHFNLIVGNGGMGKSTLMKHFFLDCLNNNELIPIFVELRGYNGKDDLVGYCYDVIASMGFELSIDYFQYALESGYFLIILDGFDEIIQENKKGFLQKVESFTDKYPDNYYFVSSRPCEEFIGWTRFYKYKTCRFTKEKAINLIKKLDYDETIKNKFLAQLNDELYDRHTSFASNPLLLNIMLLTFENYAEIPQKLHIFYNQAFETLYAIHDATKPKGFKRDLLSNLPSDIFKQVFSNFCFISYIRGKIEFTHEEILDVISKAGNKIEGFNSEHFLEDIKSGVSLVFLDGITYRFIHRSFQEYFTAYYLRNLDDDLQKKTSQMMIEKNRFSYEHDSVFSMLQDMNKKRFDKNILLPYLENIENTITSKERVRAYFSYFVESMIITSENNQFIGDEFNYSFGIFERNVQFRIKLKKSISRSYLFFMFHRFRPDNTSSLNLERHFSKYLNVEIDNNMIYRDTSLFNKIISETIFGKFIKRLSGLYDELKSNQKTDYEEIEKLFEY